MYNNGNKYLNYDYVPTCVFTPSEYACVGLSEEKAINKYGDENIEVYHLKYNTIEGRASHRSNFKGDILDKQCYTKIICNKLENERIIGIHICGDNASEIIQGYSIAMTKGLTKEELDNCTALHPTHAEELLQVNISKRSNLDFDLRNC